MISYVFNVMGSSSKTVRSISGELKELKDRKKYIFNNCRRRKSKGDK